LDEVFFKCFAVGSMLFPEGRDSVWEDGLDVEGGEEIGWEEGEFEPGVERNAVWSDLLKVIRVMCWGA
jgi:hypothetical protein